MIQVRCPECGYIQSLSEERFLTHQDSFFNCPHCNAAIPKKWNANSGDSIPEEAAHKILAFSRRILNGGEITRDVIHALETLLTRYGPTPEGLKALGQGYLALEENRKAEEFLIQALQDSPDDTEIMRGLATIYLEDERFDQARDYSAAVVRRLGAAVEDEDVAALALALIGMDDIEEAEALMSSYPNLDHRNPMVKQVKRKLKRGATPGLRSILSELAPSHILERISGWGESQHAQEGPESVGILNSEGRTPAGGAVGDARKVKRERRDPAAGPAIETKPKPEARLEYWVYSSGTAAPKRDTIRRRLVDALSDPESRRRILRLLDKYVDERKLRVEYIFKQDAKDVFAYPEDLIPRNSRGLDKEDAATLREARMIVRVRLSTSGATGQDRLKFMMSFVEAIRALTEGVVQDAVSHTLWNSRDWKELLESGLDSRRLDTHVQFEALDEGTSVWIHSHGMEKFGYPELELDHVPNEMASWGTTFLRIVAYSLLESKAKEIELQTGRQIQTSPFRYKLEAFPSDDELHFPAGSLRVLPYVADYDPDSPDTVRHVLRLLETRARRDPQAVPEEASAENAARPQTDKPQKGTMLRTKLLDAHRNARKELPTFKESFQTAETEQEMVHAVKVGFPAENDQLEWMWVSLDNWRGSTLAGHLENAPTLRNDLSKGCEVRIQEGDIFDWVIVRSGEIVGGGFTEKVMS